MLHNPATGQDNAMSLLSTFLLQGWVMTDEKCRVPDCYVPIMRSKDGSVRFCVTHDPLPTSSPDAKGASVQPTTRSTEKEINQYTDAAAAAVKSELKDNKDDDAALLRKRREQSSRASQIIGQKLLQRWTLLNEVCPNPECYAIPLMRDPSKRMICVNCNRSYITEEEAKTDWQTSKQEPVKNEVEKATAERFEDQSHRKKQKTLEDEKKSAVKAIQRKASVDIGKLHAQRVPSSSTVLDAIDTKLQDLINQLQDVSDPSRLKLIFEAIEAAARAKKACAEADKAFS